MKLQKLLSLPAALYTGMLAEYKRADIPYVPHITLGAFTREPARLIQAFDEASKLHPSPVLWLTSWSS